MQRSLLALFAAVSLVAMSACGTVKGMGEDISAVGHWFVKGSDKVENGR